MSLCDAERPFLFFLSDDERGRRCRFSDEDVRTRCSKRCLGLPDEDRFRLFAKCFRLRSRGSSFRRRFSCFNRHFPCTFSSSLSSSSLFAFFSSSTFSSSFIFALFFSLMFPRICSILLHCPNRRSTLRSDPWQVPLVLSKRNWESGPTFPVGLSGVVVEEYVFPAAKDGTPLYCFTESGQVILADYDVQDNQWNHEAAGFNKAVMHMPHRIT